MSESRPPEPSLISPDLRARLEALKEVLSSNGTVLLRREPDRKPSWRLRFRMPSADGRHRKHCSIALPNPQEAMAVKRLIETWKERRLEQRRAARQAEQARRQADRREKAERRYRRLLVEIAAGGSRRHRKRIGRLYDRVAQQGLRAEMQFIFNNHHLQPPRRPGRPRKGGLVLPRRLSGHNLSSPGACFEQNCSFPLEVLRSQAEIWRQRLQEEGLLAADLSAD